MELGLSAVFEASAHLFRDQVLSKAIRHIHTTMQADALNIAIHQGEIADSRMYQEYRQYLRQAPC